MSYRRALPDLREVALACAGIEPTLTGAYLAFGRFFVCMFRFFLVLLLVCSTSTRVLAQVEDPVVADETIDVGESLPCCSPPAPVGVP